jgi:hypothetical protein
VPKENNRAEKFFPRKNKYTASFSNVLSIVFLAVPRKGIINTTWMASHVIIHHSACF